MKRAARYKAEVIDVDGNVHWEVLVRDAPSATLRAALTQHGFVVRRTSEPRPDATNLVYSPLDPDNSLVAAEEQHTRRETQNTATLMLLLRRMPDWVSRDDIRRVGGEDGPRRFRELRQRNWPVEIRQLRKGEAWHMRMADEDLLRAWEKRNRGDRLF